MIEINKINKILPAEEKKNAVLFFFLSIIMMILESFSIGLIFPLIIVGLSDNYEQEKTYLLLKDYFEGFSYQEIIFLLLIFLVTIYILKNIFLLYLVWWKNGFCNRIQYKIEKKLLRIYLFQPYLDILKKNSALKIRNIVKETSRFAKFFLSTMNLFIEIMVLAGITSIIFFLQPEAAVYLLVLIILITVFFYFIAKIKAIKWGKEKIFHSGQTLKALVEGLSAIKEIKVFKKENFFIKNFSNHNKQVLNVSRKFSTFNESPRILIESISVFAISFAIIFMFNNGEEKSEILAMIGIFAAAGFRLLPSTSRIITCINDIKNNLPSMDLIIEEFNLKNINEKSFGSKNLIDKFNSDIEFNNIEFSYSDVSKPIIENLNFKIKKGSINAIVGKSGTGKSTILNLLLGFIQANRGTLKIDGKILSENYHYSKNFFGYVSQEIFLLDESIEYNISFGEENVDKEKLYKAIKIAQLSDFISKLEKGVETRIGEKGLNISGGQRQRIAIARAVYLDAEILILDEATNELDEDNENKIIENLISLHKHKTIILTTHNQNILKSCDQIISIKDNKFEVKYRND